MDFSSLKSVMNKNGQNVQKMEGTKWTEFAGNRTKILPN